LRQYGDGMKLLIAETIGLVIACAGVFMIHIPSGFIVTGVAVVAMIEANA
jgi:hypothetical protein